MRLFPIVTEEGRQLSVRFFMQPREKNENGEKNEKEFVLPHGTVVLRRPVDAGQRRPGLYPLESARRGSRPSGQGNYLGFGSLFARRHTAGGAHQHRHLVVRCPHPSRIRPAHGPYRLGPFGVVFAGWHHSGQWRCGRYGEIVGCGQRSGEGHPPRPYRFGRIGVVFAGWHHSGQWQCGRYGEIVGCGQRSGEGHPPRPYGGCPFGVVFAGWHQSGQWRCGRYGEIVGCGQRSGEGHPPGPYGPGQFGVVFTGWHHPGQWQF